MFRSFKNDLRVAILATLFGILGLFATGIGSIQEYRDVQLKRNSSTASAKIVRFHDGFGPNSGRFPVFQFQADGKTWTVVSQRAMNTFSGSGPFQMHDVVTIFYDPQDPRKAEIESKEMSPELALIIIGLLCLLFGVGLLRAISSEKPSFFYSLLRRP
jgi:hypothetical protein